MPPFLGDTSGESAETFRRMRRPRNDPPQLAPFEILALPKNLGMACHKTECRIAASCPSMTPTN
jgi:hypothetical protein